MFNTRLIFLIAPAMLGLVLFASVVINDNFDKQQNAHHISRLIEVSILNNKLVHELQKERGMSSGAITLNGSNFTDKLKQQRQITDSVISERSSLLNKYLTNKNFEEIHPALKSANQNIAKIAKYRELVDAQTIEHHQLMSYYSNIIKKLINIVLPTIKISNKDKLTNLLQTYYNLIQAKELAGQERALVASILSGNNKTVFQHEQYISLVAIQSSYLSTFNLLATSDLRAFFNQSMEDASVSKVLAIRKQVLNTGKESRNNSDALVWFDLATTRINQLAKVEAEIVRQLKAETYNLAKHAESILSFSVIYSLMAIGLTWLLFYQLMKIQRVQKQQQELLRKFGLVIENTPNSVVVTDADGYIEFTNEAFSNMTGYSPDEVLGQKPRMWRSGQTSQETYDEINSAIDGNITWYGELLNHKKDKQPYWAKTKIFPITDEDGKVDKIVALQEDITTQKAAEEKIKFLANYDELTGLPSLRLGKDRLKQAILSAQRHKLAMAVLFIDLDGFKAINDNHGHAAGDTVLKEIGERIVSILRNTDTVARIGGDEFMVVLTNLKKLAAIDKICRNTIEVITQPIDLVSTQVSVGASIGVAISPGDSVSSTELLEQADKAMYHVKHSGKNGFAYFSDINNSKNQR